MTKTLYKSLILVSAIFSIGFTLHAQDFWEELNTPNGIHIYSIAINDAGQIFLGAANNGAPAGVYRSDDLGDTWDLVFDNGELQVSPVEISWYQDVFIGKRGFEQLMVSHDSGNTWDSLFFPVLNSITEIFSPGLDTLFVSYADGGARLLRTYDNTMTWDTVFFTTNSTEYIKDILQTQSGDMYIALTGYFPDMGGVYKSTDGGNNWELSGLFNYMVSSLAENTEGDVFAGVRGILQSGLSPGIFVLRSGEDTWEKLLGGYQISDVAINSEDHIYCSIESSIGVIRSLDNGQNFEIVNEGLPPGPRGSMAIDELDYIYVIAKSASHSLHRTINPTVIIVEGSLNSSSQLLIIYPNPAREYINILNLPENHDNSFHLSIYNSMGSLIMHNQRIRCTEQCRINISSLEPGYYLIKMIDNNVIRYGRFLKQ